MMPSHSTKKYIVELDGSRFQVKDGRLLPVDDLREIAGDNWLVTDLQEGMSRVMTVEGPVKYAELLARRKLQESGEFEEAVEILAHWKRKRGKNATEIFFTAVPTRLARFYFEELREQTGINLVFCMYGVLWEQLKRTRSKTPIAVVLRHNRFAEVLVGSRDRVYFANRCVAFDTEKEQLNALWTTIQSDIETVESEHRIEVSRIMRINWVDAAETPDWPASWQSRLYEITPETVLQDEATHAVSWPRVLKKQVAWKSASSGLEKLLYYAQKWAPLANVGLLAVALVLFAAMVGHRRAADEVLRQTAAVQKNIGQVHLSLPKESLDEHFDGLLKFVEQLDRNHRAPSYQQIIADLTMPQSNMLALDQLKVDFGAEQIRLELYGKIEASFERAHAGYQGLLRRLDGLGYAVQESRFETEISKSQIMLKLTRPLT